MIRQIAESFYIIVLAMIVAALTLGLSILQVVHFALPALSGARKRALTKASELLAKASQWAY